jgi:hypothetical protein
MNSLLKKKGNTPVSIVVGGIVIRYISRGLAGLAFVYLAVKVAKAAWGVS